MAVRPDVFVIYGLYLLMFLAAVLLGYLAFRRYRRPGAAAGDPPELGVVPPSADEGTAVGPVALGDGPDPDGSPEEARLVPPSVPSTYASDGAAPTPTRAR
jgi:hypothetical protein